MDAVRKAMSSVKVPNRHDRVFNDECMFSFDTPYTPTGLYTSLTTWQSFGEDFVSFDFERHNHPLYLKQVWKRIIIPKDENANNDPMQLTTEDSKPLSKTPPSKMAIGVDGGFNLDEQRYSKHITNSLIVFPQRFEIPLPNADLPTIVTTVTDIILTHDGFQRSAAIAAAAWEEEQRTESKYARNLEQPDTNGKTISPDPKKWECEESGLRENLWLNLSTGHIGSGRRNWDGTGGTGAAQKHFEETGKKYPLVVKLGTITPQGADVFSYADDENDMVIDPLLATHLAHWGINMQVQEKTEKTVTELQIELNANYNFSKITESGSNLEPLNGSGYVGLDNLGNSCYMSSVMQIIMSIPEVEKRFKERVEGIFKSAPEDPSEDLLTMMGKLSSGLLSDRYVKPTPLYEKKGDNEGIIVSNVVMKEEEYGSVKPVMFKNVIGKGHVEFSSGRQQDASEFFQHFLDKMTRAELVGKHRLLAQGEQREEFAPLAALFEFELEDRIEDGQTNKVKYLTRSDNLLSLNIDVDDAVNKKQYDEFEEQSKKRPKYDDDIEEVAVALDIPLSSCVGRFSHAEVIENFQSPETGKKGHAMKRTRFKTFPEYLTVHLKRYYLDEHWMPKKLDACVNMPLNLDLEHLRSKGLQPGEVVMADNDNDNNTGSSNIINNNRENSASSAAGAGAVVPDAGIVKQLMDMGFSENGSKRAAIATNNSSTQANVEWVFAHMSEANFNDPVEEEQVSAQPQQPSSDNSKGNGVGVEISAEAIGSLTVMGFTGEQSKAALMAVGGSLERAADWLFSHADGLDAAVNEVMRDAERKQQEDQLMANGAEGGVSDGVHLLDGKGVYEMVGFASHLGSNTSCGHYVAHIRKEGRFVLYNDEKVAVSKKAPTDLGFLYVYRRKH